MSSDFDQYSRDYHRSIAHPVRSLLESGGENAFLRAKARWIDRWWTAAARPSPARVLDFGCGTGELTRDLHDLRPDWQYSGADPSAGMIDQARAAAPFADFTVLGDDPTPFAGRRHDLVLMSGVCHHVPWEHWELTFSQVRSALAPGGALLIFEHNPYNPLTQIVVRSTPIDHDAQMRTASFVSRALRRFGFVVAGCHYLHFFPPRLTALQGLERALAWLPLGSQYLLLARLADQPPSREIRGGDVAR
jgi:SAM-dependent methyltransferase